MKFCNLLRETAETIPDIQTLFDGYKQLKKTLRQMVECQVTGQRDEAARLQTDFVLNLKTCIEQVNDRFMEEEEIRVIQMANLEEQANSAQTEERCREIANRFADFHGEMLLFVHSAMLGCTCLLKILKKYTKKTGNQLIEFRRDHLAEMPICSTEIANSIARRAEGSIDTLLARQEQIRAAGHPFEAAASESRPTIQGSERVTTLMGKVRVAIDTWEQLKNTASTPSTILDTQLAAFAVPSVSGSVSLSSHSSVGSNSS